MSLSPEGPRSPHDVRIAPPHITPRPVARDLSSCDSMACDAADRQPAAAPESSSGPCEARLRHEVWTLREVIPSCPHAGKVILERIMDRLEQITCDSSDCFAVRLALEEGIINAIKHGNAYDQQKHVHVSCQLLPNRVCVEIEDEGPGFDPASVPDCTEEENLEAPSGRGIALIRCFMSSVEYRNGGRRLIMEKRFSSSQS
jgi:serine/threonine-protein kinase RsbW